METAARGLLPRNYDSHGRLQMAESRPESQWLAVTPVEELFLVHHYDQPSVDLDGPVVITDLQGRAHTVEPQSLRSMPTRSVTAVLECAGNDRGARSPRAPGNQFGLGLSGQVTCTGVSLVDLLAGLGLPLDDWTTVLASAPDAGVTLPENVHANFAKGLPRDKALHPDTLLAWEMNGAPIPVEHGGPLRLIVPGWYGIWWVKWLQRLELSRDDFTGFWQNQRYTYQDDDANVLSVVEEQLPRAVLLQPQPGAKVVDGAPLVVRAWGGGSPIAVVHVSVDDGASWFEAEQVTESGCWSWQEWSARLPSGLPRGLRRIAVRATDAAGRTQDWQPGKNRLGYGNNGVHVAEVDLVAPRPASGA